MPQLKAAFSPQELRIAGFTAAQLKPFYCSVERKGSGFFAQVSGFTLPQLKGAFSTVQLKAAPFPLRDLKPEFTIDELKMAGFTVNQFKDATY